MVYNIYISCKLGKYNLFGISEEQLEVVKKAYFFGESNYTLAGETRHFEDVNSFQIFRHDDKTEPIESSNYYLGNINYRKKGLFNTYLPESTLLMMGAKITSDIIGNSTYGEKKINSMPISGTNITTFVNQNRIKELRNTESNEFDQKKLIKLCEEINDNYLHGNFMAVVFIGRTILNHVPPIFGFNNFDEVANNYGGAKNSSFKKSMTHLNSSLKNIADSNLHQPIRKKESLPNETQVDFKQDLDVLLGEIIRLL